MLKRAVAITMLLGAFVAGLWAASPRPAVGIHQATDSATQALERAIEQELSRRGGVGATVAAVANGRVLLAKSFGRPQTRSAVVVMINNEDGPLANALVEHAMAAVLPQRAAQLPVTTGPSAAREDRGAIPRVAGPEPGAQASALFKALQNGTLDRSALGDEYSAFATDAKVRAASLVLKPLGEITGVHLRSVGERGGMEVSSVRLTLGSHALDALMYRSADGKVQEYLLFRP